jgi:Amt family ammonium transporter
MRKLLYLFALLPGFAFAEDAAPALSSGNTAWLLTATALVLFMTVPGLGLFYGGMVRKKNMLSTVMQSIAVAAIASIVWMVIGYTLAFTPGNGFIGGLSKAFLWNVDINSLTGTAGANIPETVFITFQMTFAIITSALITGAFAERIKFSALVVFITAWIIVVYAPIAHWVWEGTGWLFKDGALDYAGGLVVHINSGAAGLVAAIVIGKRLGYRKEAMPPHNLLFTLIGMAMLWVGWFGFNAGSALAADTRAGMALLVTQIASAAAAISWLLVEWIHRGKPSALGLASGAVAGLVVITPAAGFVNPSSALIMGLLGGVVCYGGAIPLKNKLGYDDSLDAFGIHGIGGIFGAIVTAIFASNTIAPGAVKPLLDQLITQCTGVVATIAYTVIVTFILLKIIDKVIGLRVSEEEEREGLDLSQHGERIE